MDKPFGPSMNKRPFLNLMSTKQDDSYSPRPYDQIHVGGACGNATGRNIHQRSLDEAVSLTKAISAITLADYSIEEAKVLFPFGEGASFPACLPRLILYCLQITMIQRVWYGNGQKCRQCSSS